MDALRGRSHKWPYLSFVCLYRQLLAPFVVWLSGGLCREVDAQLIQLVAGGSARFYVFFCFSA